MWNKIGAIFILGAALQLYSMEKPLAEEREKLTTPKLIVNNNTDRQVEILYKTKESSEEVARMIPPHDFLTLDNPRSITDFKVPTYGRVMGTVSTMAYMLGQPLGFELPDYGPEIKKAAKSGKSVGIAISEKKELGWVPTGPVSKALPYTVEVLPYATSFEPTPFGVQTRSLKDIFPRVAQAVREGALVIPRYFLDLPDKYSSKSIKPAYDDKARPWEQIAQSGRPEEREFAQRVLQILNLAYTSLKNEAQLRDFAKNELKD